MSDGTSVTKEQSHTVTGMRGGLGRTLLSAFLLFTIVPLAVISYLAVDRARQDLRQEVSARLAAVARLKEAEIEGWATSLNGRLDVLATSPAGRGPLLDLLSGDAASTEDRVAAEQMLQAVLAQGDLVALGVADASGRIVASAGPWPLDGSAPVAATSGRGRLIGTDAGSSLVAFGRAIGDDSGTVCGHLIGLTDLSVLSGIALNRTELGETGEAYLIDGDFEPITPLQAEIDPVAGANWHTEGIEAALAGGEGVALYTGYRGSPVVGSYRWLPAVGAALIVEQLQEEALAREDALATLLMGATLAVALLTTLLAAVITRRLSRPIVKLTLSAVKIAGGDLEQTVPVKRDDEIGILAQAFNIMTKELRTLYTDLERQVALRTTQLQMANQQLRYQAMQLALSSELGRAISSILDLDELLQRVVELIRESYRLRQTAVYLFDEKGRRIVRQACLGWDGTRLGSGDLNRLTSDHLVQRAVRQGVLQQDDLRTNLVIPLKAADQVIGVLKLQAYRGDELGETDTQVLEGLAAQISVAVQNAQTYAVERGTVDRLHRLDQIRTQSLSSMSRELATSLNSIIGFSRLILKGVDGPLTEQQRSDVMTINRSGQHLQGLLDDILELIDLENGAHPLEQNLVEVG
jgi:HAMP domain-containing protein